MSVTDNDLTQRILEATLQGKVNWEPTPTVDQYTASFGGKWRLTVDKGVDPDDLNLISFWLAMFDAKGTELLRIYSTNAPWLPELYEAARRRALKIDAAIEDFLNELYKQ